MQPGAQPLDLQALRALPKIDLHRHLEGSLRPATLWEFHQRQGQALHSSLEALRAACTIPKGAPPGFLPFLARFDMLRFYYGEADAIARLAGEAVEDAADDGVIHLELRFSPVFFARRMSRVPLPLSVPPSIDAAEEAAEAVVSGARRAAAARGVGVSFIVTLARHFGVEVNRPAAALLARPIGASFSGLDLAGDESVSARPFAEIFHEWKAAGKGITVHAGEAPDADGAANVREAIDILHADRIGHGIRACDDERLLSRIVDEKIVLELSLTSNLQTRACAALSSHPLKRLLERGVYVTLNTDDPAISDISLSSEYALAVQDCVLTVGQLRTCALNAAHATFLPSSERERLARKIAARFPSTAAI